MPSSSSSGADVMQLISVTPHSSRKRNIVGPSESGHSLAA